MAPATDYCRELATAEKTLFAFPPTNRSVPTTITRMTASITAYSAMSCPVSAAQSLCNSVPMLHLPAFLRATKSKEKCTADK